MATCCVGGSTLPVVHVIRTFLLYGSATRLEKALFLANLLLFSTCVSWLLVTWLFMKSWQMLLVVRFMLICVGILPLDSDSSGCASQCVACEFEIGKHFVITWHIFIKFFLNILSFYIICHVKSLFCIANCAYYLDMLCSMWINLLTFNQYFLKSTFTGSKMFWRFLPVFVVFFYSVIEKLVDIKTISTVNC